MRVALGFAIAILACSGCRTGLSYDQPASPRYARAPADAAARTAVAARGDTVHVVSFNIEYALQVDSAIALFRSDEAMGDADIVLLQEMDEEGTKRIAAALDMGYVYYPASFNLKYLRDVGNAVLSRWPMMDDRKIILPHRSRLVGTHRGATGVTLRMGDATVRVYSAHLGTVANVSPEQRRDQLRAIMANAARFPRVILGGDMNDPFVGRTAVDGGYAWPTEEGPHTAFVVRIDHIFLKGLRAVGTGTVLENRHASDHRPIWLRAVLSRDEGSPTGKLSYERTLMR